LLRDNSRCAKVFDKKPYQTGRGACDFWRQQDDVAGRWARCCHRRAACAPLGHAIDDLKIDTSKYVRALQREKTLNGHRKWWHNITYVFIFILFIKFKFRNLFYW
jgi:hypothetical protein